MTSTSKGLDYKSNFKKQCTKEPLKTGRVGHVFEVPFVLFMNFLPFAGS